MLCFYSSAFLRDTNYMWDFLYPPFTKTVIFILLVLFFFYVFYCIWLYCWETCNLVFISDMIFFLLLSQFNLIWPYFILFFVPFCSVLYFWVKVFFYPYLQVWFEDVLFHFQYYCVNFLLPHVFLFWGRRDIHQLIGFDSHCFFSENFCMDVIHSFLSLFISWSELLVKEHPLSFSERLLIFSSSFCLFIHDSKSPCLPSFPMKHW